MPNSPSPQVLVHGVSRAFGRALVSQCHPLMLLAVLLPFVVILVGAVVLLWFFWTPVTAMVQATLSGWPVFEQVDAWLLALGLVSIQFWLVPVLAALILLPLSGLIGLAVAAVFIMPLVLRHLGQGRYADVQRASTWAFAASLWNAVWVILVFCVGWLLTMPLWLFPPLALVLPTLWWTFAFTMMLRFDALADHASPQEREGLWRRHRLGFWTLGLICALLSLLPPLWLFLPVFSSLLFAHYGLEALRAARAEGSSPPADHSGALVPASVPATHSPRAS